jgi:hypothetical protein
MGKNVRQQLIGTHLVEGRRTIIYFCAAPAKSSSSGTAVPETA